MLDLRTQIHAYVEDTVERIDSDDVAAAVSTGRVVSNRAPWYLRPAWVAAGAALLVLIAVGIPILSIQGDDSPENDQTAATITSEVPPTSTVTTVAPTVTAASPTTAVPLIPARLEITWKQAPTQPAFGPMDVVRSVVQGGPGLIAVGGTWSEEDPLLAGWQPVIWTSADGIAWDRTPDVPPLRGEILNDVSAGPAGFVAVGETYPVLYNDPSVLLSDDGETWTRIPPNRSAFPPEAAPAAVTDGGPGYVAAGSTQDHAAIWTSTDGISWTPVDQELGEGHAFSNIVDVVNTGSVLVAIGNGWEPLEDYADLARAQDELLVWTSSDGRVWERGMLSDVAGSSIAVTTHDGSIIAVGYEGVTPTVWISDERSDTFASNGLPAFASSYPLGALGDGDRLLVVGVQRLGGIGYAMAWASQDGGTSWYEVTFEGYSIEGPFGNPSDQRAAGFADAITFGDGFVAIGSTGDLSAPVWSGTWNEM